LDIIFTSGYASHHIVDSYIIDEYLNFLQKPYSMRDLAFMIRKILD